LYLGVGVTAGEYDPAMRHVLRFACGYKIGRVVTIVVLILVGLLLVGASGPTKAPVPAEQAIEQRHREQVLSQGYEEEQRQASYAATPGPPYPTKDWTPSR